MVNVTISYLTLACAPWGEHAKHNVVSRARAAARVGLTSLGVDFGDIPELRAHRKEVLALARFPECEWVDLGTEHPYDASQKEALRIMAGEFGTTRVNCGVCDLKTRTDQAAQNLVRLTQDAAELGMTVAVEPVAFGSHPLTLDIADVLSLAGMPANAGMLVDLWQVTYRGEMYPAPLPAKAAWPVAEIQLCGGTRPFPRTARGDSQNRRSLAEDGRTGSGNIRYWLRAFNVMNAPVSYEVPRTDWREMELEDVAALVAEDLKVLG